MWSLPVTYQGNDEVQLFYVASLILTMSRYMLLYDIKQMNELKKGSSLEETHVGDEL